MYMQPVTGLGCWMLIKPRKNEYWLALTTNADTSQVNFLTFAKLKILKFSCVLVTIAAIIVTIINEDTTSQP